MLVVETFVYFPRTVLKNRVKLEKQFIQDPKQITNYVDQQKFLKNLSSENILEHIKSCTNKNTW